MSSTEALGCRFVECMSQGGEENYRGLGNKFDSSNCLQINARKTKELVVDFWKKKSPPAPVAGQGGNIEMINSYEHLCVYMCDKMG